MTTRSSGLRLLVLFALALTAGTALAQDSAPRGQLGVQLEQTDDGVIISKVLPDSSAEAMGALAGDRVTAADHATVTTIAELVAVLRTKRAGDRLALHVLRGEETVELEGPMQAASRPTGMVGAQAEPFEPARWGNLAEGASPPDLSEPGGKITVVFGFQHACFGCQARGFPVHAGLENLYAGDDRLRFVYVQSVFEDFGVNTYEAGLATLKELGLEGAYAFDPGDEDGAKPSFVTAYRTDGTPWSVVIDGRGTVVFSGFTPDGNALDKVVEKALAAAAEEGSD